VDVPHSPRFNRPKVHQEVDPFPWCFIRWVGRGSRTAVDGEDGGVVVGSGFGEGGEGLSGVGAVGLEAAEGGG
jgi:hypothetical protein